jgi:hypothetical protein
MCNGLSYFPNTSKIVIGRKQQSILLNNFEQFIPNLAQDFQIPPDVAYDKTVVVELTGVQEGIYQVTKLVQNSVPMVYMSQAVSLLKTMGMTGVPVITEALLTFAGTTYIGTIFFGYCGSVAGNNAGGLLFNSTSYVLSRPMCMVKTTLNGLILRPLSNALGLPLILNGTQEMLAGKGLSLQEYSKFGAVFEKINNSTVLKKIKDIYKIIRSKSSP